MNPYGTRSAKDIANDTATDILHQWGELVGADGRWKIIHEEISDRIFKAIAAGSMVFVLRDSIAMAALPSVIIASQGTNNITRDDVCAESYRVADAMVAVRSVKLNAPETEIQQLKRENDALREENGKVHDLWMLASAKCAKYEEEKATR